MNRLAGRAARLPKGQSRPCSQQSRCRGFAPPAQQQKTTRQRSGPLEVQQASTERSISSAASSNGAQANNRDGVTLEKPIDLDTKAAESGLPRVIIAGGGIGGLVAAVALLKRGYPVLVFERDLTAIRGEGKYRGPIQVHLHHAPSAALYVPLSIIPRSKGTIEETQLRIAFPQRL